ncbi:MAG: acyl--CoA ligase [Calditrichia bacterium]|nr:acyl--CoA ligase [Calditrichia bacterium]
MLVHNFLEKSAEKYPDRKAVWCKDEWMTFSEIERKSNKMANFLVQIGIKKGERIALLYENSFQYVIAYYAILKAGAVTVALNTDQTEDSMEYLLKHSDAVALIAQNKYFSILKKIQGRLPDLQYVIAAEKITENLKAKSFPWEEAITEQPEIPPVITGLIDLDLASIVYTSGSTGEPKGVTLRHVNIVTNTRSIVKYLELTKEDRIMVVLPFYYIYGKSLLNTHFFVGGSVVLDNRFTFPSVILQTMEKTKVTGFSGVPSTFTILLNKTKVKEMRFDSLRYLTQAGGAMAPSYQKEVAMTFYPAKIFIMYGATEASARLSYLDPRDLPRKWGSIGKGIPNVDLFVADQEGNRLPPGEVGEIVARGSNMMTEYWKDPEGTHDILRNGLYWSGDLGKMDEEGFTFVVGRSKDMIKVGGERVSAKEIEEKLLEHNGIHEIAIIGVPDEMLGEAVKAYIVPINKGELTENDIKSFLKGKLQNIKIPKFIEFRDNLPKNESGKILKPKLREEIENELNNK